MLSSQSQPPVFAVNIATSSQGLIEEGAIHKIRSKSDRIPRGMFAPQTIYQSPQVVSCGMKNVSILGAMNMLENKEQQAVW